MPRQSANLTYDYPTRATLQMEDTLNHMDLKQA